MTLQPSTAIVNPLHGQLVFTGTNENYRAKLFWIYHNIDSAQHKDCMNSWVTVWFYTIYIIRPAYIAGAEPTDIQALIRSGAYTHAFSLYATGQQHYSAPHMNLKLLAAYIVYRTQSLLRFH